MSTHKHIDKICCVVLALTLVLSALFMCAEALGIEASARPLGYEERLFSTDKVHTIDIIIDDWDAFISTATSEEYSVCSVVIDGEAVKSVGIRGKGNTSLSSVSSMGSQRYSFKIEFDQYDNTKSYHGLDKLSLNNVIQDNTYMKDYLTYQMMNEFGVSAPLCSYAYITVNGEDWGLYLAVEGVEDAFLRRNYGSDYGELYKPDSMSFGGGRGNGRDFDFSDFMGEDGSLDFSFENGNMPNMGNMFTPGSMSGGDKEQSTGNRPSRGEANNGFETGSFSVDEESLKSVFEELGLDLSLLEGIDFENLTMESLPSSLSALDEETLQSIMKKLMENSDFEIPDMGDFGGVGGLGGMGSSDVKLQYIDDNASSYSNIFNNAKTDITEADQNRLISSLKQLSEYDNIEDVVNIDQVLRYFVVHNYVVNGDSYTGSMIHNYYLYEEDGQLSMIPWDYNLAYGTFSGSNASSSVNESIDEVLSDRPMQAWIFSDEEYSAQYYALYAELLETVDVQVIIDNAYSLIAPYVEKDPTAFCTYEEFEKGVEAIKSFCALRRESVALQLSGSNESVSAEGLNISDMGTMGGEMGGGFGGGKNPFDSDSQGSSGKPQRPDNSSSNETEGGTIPTSFTSTNSEDSSETDNGGNQSQMPWGDGELPNTGDFDINNIPEGGMQFPGNMPGGQIPNGNSQGGSLGSANTGISVSNDTIMLIVSVAVLAGGLIFAVLFKRRK